MLKSIAILAFITLIAANKIEGQANPSRDLQNSITEDLYQPFDYPNWTSRKQFLYWAVKGQAIMEAHHYDESNECFEKACQIWMDQNILPGFSIEDSYDEVHEFALVIYLKILNYLQLGALEDAAVECKRMNDWILSDNLNPTVSHLIKEDPLIHTIMAIVYDLNNDADDASISYQQALQSYQMIQDGFPKKYFPDYLVNEYKAIERLLYAPLGHAPTSSNCPQGRLIFIWNNGQGPSVLVSGKDYKYMGTSNDLTTPSDSLVNIGVDVHQAHLAKSILTFIPLQTDKPQYYFKKSLYDSAEIMFNGAKIQLDLIEDLGWYAEKAVRYRLEAAGPHVWKAGNNWTTMPGEVYLAIVPLNLGKNQFEITFRGGGTPLKESFSIEGDGRTYICTANTLKVR